MKHCRCGKEIDFRSVNCRSCAVKKIMKNRDPLINKKIRDTLIKKGCRPPITHRKGADNPAWKGKDVLYGSLHDWVYLNFGAPSSCDHCGKDNLFGRYIDWASINHVYTRKKKDWKRLCKSCHKLYDLGKIKLLN